jgi:hypothetical protein
MDMAVYRERNVGQHRGHGAEEWREERRGIGGVGESITQALPFKWRGDRRADKSPA